MICVGRMVQEVGGSREWGRVICERRSVNPCHRITINFFGCQHNYITTENSSSPE